MSFRIGDVAAQTGLSVDTLRYYEKIRLLPPVARNASGIREYGKHDLSRLKFIQRSQKMGFSLAEISELLEFRKSPQDSKPQVRSMAQQKLLLIEERLSELQRLHDELTLLGNLCRENQTDCPILGELDGGEN